VRELVHLHGGRVEAHSDGPDQGSEFVVRLPVLESDAWIIDLPLRTARNTTTSAFRVLVVDDNLDAADVLKRILHATRAPRASKCRRCDSCRNRPWLSAPCCVHGNRDARHERPGSCQRIRKLTLVKQPLICALTGFGQERQTANVRRRPESTVTS
jgi:hypothetical protein